MLSQAPSRNPNEQFEDKPGRGLTDVGYWKASEAAAPVNDVLPIKREVMTMTFAALEMSSVISYVAN